MLVHAFQKKEKDWLRSFIADSVGGQPTLCFRTSAERYALLSHKSTQPSSTCVSSTFFSPPPPSPSPQSVKTLDGQWFQGGATDGAGPALFKAVTAEIPVVYGTLFLSLHLFALVCGGLSKVHCICLHGILALDAAECSSILLLWRSVNEAEQQHARRLRELSFGRIMDQCYFIFCRPLQIEVCAFQTVHAVHAYH